MNSNLHRRARSLLRVAYVGITGGALLAGCAGEPMEGAEEDVSQGYLSFEDFEAGTYREPGTGYYIVDGDIPLYSREELFDFYERHVAEGQLIVHRSNGQDAKWTDSQKLDLTYCVSTKFGANWATVAKAMNDAAAAWSHHGNVRFIHMTDQDGACTATNARVMFDVNPISGASYLARAFFPGSTRDKRNVIIDQSSFGNLAPWTLTGILRHELGHTLGFRHEHTRPNAATCFEDTNYRDLSSYDGSSVMHYPQCNGTQTGDLVLTPKDQLGVAALYGKRQGGATNLAYGRAATQSSTVEDDVAARAVDGNVDGDGFHHSISHTLGEAAPWWQVDLGAVKPVGEVVIHNRIDNGHYKRLYNFKLLVSRDGATWRTIDHPGNVGARVALAVNEAARFVKIQLNADGTTRLLNLGEVEVLEARNLARGRAATQSSTDFGGEAARAVDGNTNGAYFSGSVTHSNVEVSPWWQVDLGAVQPIGEVVLYNRTDCCAERLSNFKVLVSNDGASWSEHPFAGNAPTRTAFGVNRPGRYVRVQLDNVNNTPRYLSLTEVEVFAARNLARGKTATQSSNFEFLDGSASKAIDGSTDGNFSGGTSTTHTASNGEPAPWWQVDLGAVQPVGEVVLYNRTDCCSERLSKFSIQTSLDGQNFTTVRTYDGVVGTFLQVPTNRPARFVRVALANTGAPRILSLAEVEVIAGRNLSFTGTATQSSDWLEGASGIAVRAIDGNTDGDFFKGSVSHTHYDNQAFWRLDLGSVQPINEIYLYNRTDLDNGLRLSNFKVQVSEDGATWTDYQFPGTASARELFGPRRAARYVRVQLNGTNFLQLAEVETYVWN
jgi:hypothetical protein